MTHTIKKERRGVLPEISFGDLRTRGERLDWYVNTYKKVAVAIAVVCVPIILIIALVTKLEEKKLVDKQYANLIKYHDVNGFQPILHK